MWHFDLLSECVKMTVHGVRQPIYMHTMTDVLKHARKCARAWGAPAHSACACIPLTATGAKGTE